MIKVDPNDINKIIEITDKIQGYLLHEEGKLLYSLARKCSRDNVIVEIGSWKGRSTTWLYFGSVSGNKAKIYSIDPHIGSQELRDMFGVVSTFKEFESNMKKIGALDLVKSIVKKSEKAAGKFNEKVGLIFIDGDHSYQSVKKDFDLWFPKLVDGGTIAFHDTIMYQSVNKLVKKVMFKSKNIRVIKMVDSIVCGEKCQKLSIVDLLRNRYILALHNICVYFSVIKIPYSLVKVGRVVIDKIH